MKSNESQHSIFELTREQKGAKAINQERKIDSSSSDVIKTFTLDKPITDATVVLKSGNRQTDRHTDRQNTYLPFDRPYPFSLGNIVHKAPYVRAKVLHAFKIENPLEFDIQRYLSDRFKNILTTGLGNSLFREGIFC